MRISDWSSDVCSSDLTTGTPACNAGNAWGRARIDELGRVCMRPMPQPLSTQAAALSLTYSLSSNRASFRAAALENVALIQRQTLSTRHRQKEAAPKSSEEHTSELQSLMRHSYAVFCL